jgi:hypothetical protein
LQHAAAAAAAACATQPAEGDTLALLLLQLLMSPQQSSGAQPSAVFVRRVKGRVLSLRWAVAANSCNST